MPGNTEKTKKLSDNLKNNIPADYTPPEVLYDELLDTIRRYHPSKDLSDIERAYKLSLIHIQMCIRDRFITAVAEQLECELSDSFFELGNLNQDTLTSNLLSGPKLNGTSEEKQKYWKIKRLHETISKALEWAPVEKAFSGMNCIKLAIQNCGKAIDEDAEIMFEVPKESLLTLGEFPKFNNEMCIRDRYKAYLDYFRIVY